MAYLPSPNGGRLNASIGGNSTSAGAGYALMSTGTMYLAGGNNITLSQDGQNVTILGGNGVALANSQTTYTSGTANFLEGGGAITIASTTGQKFNFSVPATSSLSVTGALSLSVNGSTVSIGAPAFSAGINTLGNTAGTTGTVSNQMIFAGGNNITLSQSTGAGGNTLTISAANQTNQLITVNATGANTTGQSSSNTLDARSFNISAMGGLYAGLSGNTLQLSAATTYAASNHSHGNPTLNLTNLSGTTASASNGLTLSLSAAAQTNQSLGMYASGANTIGQSSSSTFDARSLNFSGQGGVSVGFSGSTMQLSAPVASSVSATGALSISTNGNTVSMGVPAVSMGMSNIGNTSGTSGTVSNQLIFAGGNNITLSQSTGAGGNTLTISAGNGGVALANSQTTYVSGTANFLEGGGAITIASTTGQKFNFSVPGTSSLSATGAFSISTNGNTISMGVPTQTNQTVGLYALGNTTQNSSTTLDARTLSFNGLGAATMGYSNGSIQVSVPTQTNQSVGLYALGNTTQSSSGTRDARSLSFNGLGGISVGFSNGSYQISGPVAQTNQNMSLYALGNTTQNSSTLLNASNLSFNGLGAATMGYSNGSIQVSVPTQTNQTGNFYVSSNSTQLSSTAGIDLRSITFMGAGIASVGVSQGKVLVSATQSNQNMSLYALGNTTQNSSTLLNASNLSFNGLGAATMGYSNGSIQVSAPAQSTLSATGAVSISTNGSTISIGAPTQTNQSIGFTAGTTGGGNTSLTSTGTFDARSMYLNAYGNISAGFSASSMFLSSPVQTNQTLGLAFTGNTTQSSTGTKDARSLTFNGLGNVSVGYSNGSIQISGGGGGGGAALSAGTQSVSTGTVNFANSNNITFGMSGSSQITASYSQSNQTVGLYALGNTTQNSSTTLDARTLSFNGLGGATVGYSNGTIQISAPTGGYGANREYLRAKMVADQTTNLSGGDHIKFDTVEGSSGSSISADTTTTYTSSGGASIGRFTLTAGKTYVLRATVPRVAFGSANSSMQFQWVNVTAGGAIGTMGGTLSTTWASSDISNTPYAEAVFTPGVTTIVELQISVSGSMTTIGDSSSATGRMPSAYIEVVSGGPNISTGREYVRAELRSAQSSNLTAGTDHVKFATVQASSGTNISLDTTTTYASGAGSASIGRFTLAAGKSYLLRASIPEIDVTGAASTGYLAYCWYDATNSVYLGNSAVNASMQYSNNAGGYSAYAEAVFSPGSTTLIELRVVNQSGVVSIAAGNNRYANAYIELLDTGGTNTYVNFAAGTTNGNLSSVSFSNANGIGWGLNGSTITAANTLTFSAGSQSTLTASGTMNMTAFNLNGVGAASIGFSNSSAFISVPVQTNQSIGLYALGNTTQNSSTTLDARTLSFNGLGAATMGYSNGSIQVSVPTQTNQSIGFTAGTTGGGNTLLTSTGTFDARSMYLNAYGAISAGFSASSMFISSPVQSNQNMSLYALGNTTQNSSTLLNASNLSFNGIGGVSVGYSNGSIQISGATGGGGGGGGVAIAASNTTFTSGTVVFSVSTGALTISSGAQSVLFQGPTQSSLAATGALSIASTGSTVSIGAPLGGSPFGIASKTTNYTVTSSDTMVLADATSGNVTITLPLASTVSGYRFYIKRVDSTGNTVTVARSGSDTIDGATSVTITSQWTVMGVVSNGSNWYVI